MVDYDQMASEYARWRRVHPEVLRHLLTTSGVNRSGRVLEVGCGTGNYIITVQAGTQCDAWGVDPSGQMLCRARERTENVQFVTGKAEKLDFEPGTFDLVFSVDVIHHVSDRLGYFREAQRVLRPGGRVCTVTDSEGIIRTRQPMSQYFPESIQTELERYPKIVDLRELMEQVGLVNIQEELVETTYTLEDVGIYRDKAFSALHLISGEAFERGMRRMERDFQEQGVIQGVSRYIMLWGRKAL